MEHVWTIADLAEGCEFTIRKGGIVWVKGKPQGMYEQVVYCKAKIAKSARPGHAPIHRQRMFEQKTPIHTTNCA